MFVLLSYLSVFLLSFSLSFYLSVYCSFIILLCSVLYRPPIVRFLGLTFGVGGIDFGLLRLIPDIKLTIPFQITSLPQLQQCIIFLLSWIHSETAACNSWYPGLDVHCPAKCPFRYNGNDW